MPVRHPGRYTGWRITWGGRDVEVYLQAIGAVMPVILDAGPSRPCGFFFRGVAWQFDCSFGRVPEPGPLHRTLLGQLHRIHAGGGKQAGLAAARGVCRARSPTDDSPGARGRHGEGPSGLPGVGQRTVCRPADPAVGAGQWGQAVPGEQHVDQRSESPADRERCATSRVAWQPGAQ
ncbi:hypothetical protein FQZ97_1045190 [compost metagenome]